MNLAPKLTILLLLWAILFLPVYPELADAWLANADNSHGLLVPLISLYLIWKQRATLSQTPLSYSWWGAALLGLNLVLFLLSYAGDLALTMRLAMIGTLLGLLLLVLGPAMFRQMRFALLFLLFMVPVPDALTSLVSFPLQQFATTASASIIRWLSIPVVQEGNMLYFVRAQLEVAQACSGIRSLLALTMLGVLFAHALGGPRRGQWLLVLSAIPVALFANILRVSGTGVLAHFFGDGVARGFLHLFSGIAIFLFGILALSAEYRLLARFNPRPTARSAGDAGRNK